MKGAYGGSGSPAELKILNGGHDIPVWATDFDEGLKYMFENGLSSAR